MGGISTGQPIIRWAGSKRKLVPRLSTFWDTRFETYIEPFAGSAQLFFALKPKKAVLSDINAELINTYLQIQSRPSDVFYAIESVGSVTKEHYYFIRSIVPNTLNDVERAARFLILNRFCFNGLYRTNLSGAFNVPYSNQKNGRLPTQSELERCSETLQSTKIVCEDFETVLKQYANGNAFVYLDPPFANINKRIFSQYNAVQFGGNDMSRLISSLNKVDDSGAHFLVSYAYCKESLETFSNWKKYKVITQRNIAGFSSFRKKAAELLATNIGME